LYNQLEALARRIFLQGFQVRAPGFRVPGFEFHFTQSQASLQRSVDEFGSFCLLRNRIQPLCRLFPLHGIPTHCVNSGGHHSGHEGDIQVMGTLCKLHGSRDVFFRLGDFA
jgi:hypothetical protein